MSLIKTLNEGALSVEGPKLFNSLPRSIRNFDGPVDRFKNLLDNFLHNIPDQPCGKIIFMQALMIGWDIHQTQ